MKLTHNARPTAQVTSKGMVSTLMDLKIFFRLLIFLSHYPVLFFILLSYYLSLYQAVLLFLIRTLL